MQVTIVFRDPGDRHRFIEDAFTGCESLKTIVIPNSVEKMEKWRSEMRISRIGRAPEYAGHDRERRVRICPSIKTIVIPEAGKDIGEEAFVVCKSSRA
ncbi:MAG: hypothetical protein E7Z68_08085 [Thermoplasmata archaeon]|nr:hypothetical protein [Thermoplasmata archaeon]